MSVLPATNDAADLFADVSAGLFPEAPVLGKALGDEEQDRLQEAGQVMFDRVLQRLLDLPEYPSADVVFAACCRLGRNAPALVLSLHYEDCLLAEVAAGAVPHAWSAVEFPHQALAEGEWRELFDFAGYTREGVPADRPTEPLTLWRGALAEHRRGWSWTDDLDLARWFADRPLTDRRGRVWVATVEPARLLARISTFRTVEPARLLAGLSQAQTGEPQYVVDARGLDVADNDAHQRIGA